MAWNLKRALPQSSYWVDVSWVAMINALAQGIGVLVMPLLTRLYGPGDFAALNIFVNTIALAGVLISLRFEYMLQLAADDRDATALLHIVLLLSCVGGLISTPLMWSFRVELSTWMGEPALAPYLVLVPLFSALASISVALQSAAQRARHFKNSSGSEVVNKLGYCVVASIGGWFWAGPAALLCASAAGTIGKILWLVVRTPTKPVPPQGSGVEQGTHPARLEQDSLLNRFDGSSVRRVVLRFRRLSGSLVLSHLMMTLTGLTPTLFISKVYGSFVLGQYALVMTTIFLPSGLIGAAIGQVYYQRAAAHWSRGEGFGALWKLTARKLLLIGAPLYAAAALLSPWAYPWLFGSAWESAGRIAPFMAIAAFLSFLSGPLDRSCVVVGAWRYIPFWHFLRLVTTILIAGLAWKWDWQSDTFLAALALQMTSMYLIDFLAERHFAKREPALAKLGPPPAGA